MAFPWEGISPCLLCLAAQPQRPTYHDDACNNYDNGDHDDADNNDDNGDHDVEEFVFSLRHETFASLCLLNGQ